MSEMPQVSSDDVLTGGGTGGTTSSPMAFPIIFINDAKRLKFETKIINNWYFTAFFLNIMNARLHASWNFDWLFKLQNLNKNPRAAF